MNDLAIFGTALMRSTAKRVSAGITRPRTQADVDRLQAADLLNEAADEIDALREQLEKQ